MTDDALAETLRAHYAIAARRATDGTSTDDCNTAGTCSPGDSDDVFGAGGYAADELAQLPREAIAGSIGCANPVALAHIEPGEDVLDLGSGGGIDVLLSARRVAPDGRAYGVDMTGEMLELARANQARAGVTNAEFLEGRIESVPLPDCSVDVVVSNCVINLSADKPAVFAEAYRLLRPHGRLAVADVVADHAPDPALKDDHAAWAGCLAGALTRDEYRTHLSDAGFVDIEITDDHTVGDGLWSVFVKAERPEWPQARAPRAPSSDTRRRGSAQTTDRAPADDEATMSDGLC